MNKKLIGNMLALLIIFTGIIFVNIQAETISTPINIASFENLKPYLEYKEVDIKAGLKGERFVLKSGEYQLSQDIEIDLTDSFFQGKEDAIKYGILNVMENFSFNGNQHKVIVNGDMGRSLFGIVRAPEFIIENLTISYK